MLNRNGFVLVDVVIAVFLGILIFVPAQTLVHSSLNTYSIGKELRIASMLGRCSMEETRVDQIGNDAIDKVYVIEDKTYTVHNSQHDIDEIYQRHEIEVQTPGGKIYCFKRLEKQGKK